MARNLDCSMETLYELCESWLCRGVGEEISGQLKDGEKKYMYDAGWSEEGALLGKEMKQSF